MAIDVDGFTSTNQGDQNDHRKQSQTRKLSQVSRHHKTTGLERQTIAAVGLGIPAAVLATSDTAAAETTNPEPAVTMDSVRDSIAAASPPETANFETRPTPPQNNGFDLVENTAATPYEILDRQIGADAVVVGSFDEDGIGEHTAYRDKAARDAQKPSHTILSTPDGSGGHDVTIETAAGETQTVNIAQQPKELDITREDVGNVIAAASFVPAIFPGGQAVPVATAGLRAALGVGLKAGGSQTATIATRTVAAGTVIAGGGYVLTRPADQTPNTTTPGLPANTETPGPTADTPPTNTTTAGTTTPTTPETTTLEGKTTTNHTTPTALTGTPTTPQTPITLNNTSDGNPETIDADPEDRIERANAEIADAELARDEAKARYDVEAVVYNQLWASLFDPDNPDSDTPKARQTLEHAKERGHEASGPLWKHVANLTQFRGV